MKVLSGLDINGNVILEKDSTLRMKTSQQDEYIYLEAGDDNNTKTLSLYDDDDNAVKICNIATPTSNSDAANKAYVDGKINDDNAVFLNGYSGTGGIMPQSLCAFALSVGGTTMYMTSFTNTSGISGGAAITDSDFPIGCKIYYHPDSQSFSATTNFTSKKFYSSYKEVDGRYSSNSGLTSGNTLGSSSTSAVYLRVSVSNGYWRPYHKSGESYENIVTSNHLILGNFYIYLGKTVGSTGYTFQLEDNNPLYYYDGTSLIDWASYQAVEAASYTAGDGIDITNNVISCVTHPYMKETFTSDSFNANSPYSKGWQNFVSTSNLEVGTYKVTLQVHLYIVAGSNNMMPADCVVNVCMRNKVTSNDAFHYILGATETLGGGTLPETAIATGRGIISRTLNVVGFMEVTGDEDSSCSLEAIFTTNSSLNVLIGNPVPRDGTYDGLCSGNDFVLLEKIA